MTDERLETLTGEGTLLSEDGRVLEENIPYGLLRFRSMIDAYPEKVRALGVVLATDIAGYLKRGDTLVLVLQDGRRVAFSFTHADGAIASRGTWTD